MAAMRFHRWDNALKRCTEKKGTGTDRWHGDPMALNQEAHELPPEKQLRAQELVEDAPESLRALLAPMWRYCFVQWHIYDAGIEALERDRPLREAFEDEALRSDVESLKAIFDAGDLDQALTAEQWTWHLVETPQDKLGKHRAESASREIFEACKQDRRDGVAAYGQNRSEKAMMHFSRGLARLNEIFDASPQMVKLRAALLKNQAACGLKLGLKRLSLRAASAALAIDPEDEKAWYRKSLALEALGNSTEAAEAFHKAGIPPPPPQDVNSANLPSHKRQFSPRVQPERLDLFTEKVVNLTPVQQAEFESLFFIEVGVDSLLAVDVIMHIQAEMPGVPIPSSLIYDQPQVSQAISELGKRLSTQQDLIRGKVASTLWRAVCRALGRDPLAKSKAVKTAMAGLNRNLAEHEALQALSELKEVYESNAWKDLTRSLARAAGFQLRSFLVKLRTRASPIQEPLLEALGHSPDPDGLWRLECSVVFAAQKFVTVGERLKATRIAFYGGHDGIWSANMEAPDDSRLEASSLQSQYLYINSGTKA